MLPSHEMHVKKNTKPQIDYLSKLNFKIEEHVFHLQSNNISISEQSHSHFVCVKKYYKKVGWWD